MSAHSLATSTRTVELIQLTEINERLTAGSVETCLLLTAEFLGLTGAAVHALGLDRAAASLLGERRRDRAPVLPAGSRLRRLLAAGAPSFPYLYGVFGETDGGRRELPALLHTEQLVLLSSVLGLRGHRWGL